MTKLFSLAIVSFFISSLFSFSHKVQGFEVLGLKNLYYHSESDLFIVPVYDNQIKLISDSNNGPNTQSIEIVQSLELEDTFQSIYFSDSLLVTKQDTVVKVFSYSISDNTISIDEIFDITMGSVDDIDIGSEAIFILSDDHLYSYPYSENGNEYDYVSMSFAYSQANKIELVGDHVLVGAGRESNLVVVNVSNPANISIIGGVENYTNFSNSELDITHNEDVIVVYQGSNLDTAIDIPHGPYFKIYDHQYQLLTVINEPELWSAKKANVKISDGKLVISTTQSICIFNIDNPVNPMLEYSFTSFLSPNHNYSPNSHSKSSLFHLDGNILYAVANSTINKIVLEEDIYEDFTYCNYPKSLEMYSPDNFAIGGGNYISCYNFDSLEQESYYNNDFIYPGGTQNTQYVSQLDYINNMLVYTMSFRGLSALDVSNPSDYVWINNWDLWDYNYQAFYFDDIAFLETSSGGANYQPFNFSNYPYDDFTTYDYANYIYDGNISPLYDIEEKDGFYYASNSGSIDIIQEVDGDYSVISTFNRNTRNYRYLKFFGDYLYANDNYEEIVILEVDETSITEIATIPNHNSDARYYQDFIELDGYLIFIDEAWNEVLLYEFIDNDYSNPSLISTYLSPYHIVEMDNYGDKVIMTSNNKLVKNSFNEMFGTQHNFFPKIINKGPSTNNISISTNMTSRFFIDIYDYEDDPITYNWYLDNQLIGVDSPSCDIIPEALGGHLVKVLISDGVNTIELSWNINVVENDNDESIISGTYFNGTLTIDSSPYTIQSDLIIDYGSEMIIEPGVEICFENSPRIVVRGTIIAEGTEDSPIIIGGNSSCDQIELFSDIDLNFDECVFSGCNIRIMHNSNNTVFNNCDFINNGSILSLCSDTSIDGCMFENSGWIYLRSCNFSIKNSKFSNTNASIRNMGSSLTITNSIFRNCTGEIDNTNWGDQGDIGESTIINNLFIDNDSYCIKMRGEENSFINNICYHDSLSISAVSGFTTITKNIFPPSGMYISGEAFYWTSYQNICNEPIYRNEDENNYRLQENSPGIDAGLNSFDYSIIGLNNDLNDTERFLDGLGDGEIVIDIGPYEYTTNIAPVIELISHEGETIAINSLSDTLEVEIHDHDKDLSIVWYRDNVPIAYDKTSCGVNITENDTVNYSIQVYDDEFYTLASWNIYYFPTENTFDDIAPKPSILYGNYPNPFNPSTSISFYIGKPGDVSLDIYNIKGQKVKSFNKEYYLEGNHTIVWDSINQDGKYVSSGIYFYRLHMSNKNFNGKMLLLK